MHTKDTRDTPTYREILRARQPRRHLLRNGFVLVGLALFVTAAALAVVAPPETPVTYQAYERLSLPEPFPQPLGYQQPSSAPFVSETQIRRGDTLAALLQRLHVHEDGLQSFLVHDATARSVYKLYPGRTVQAALDTEGRLVWLRYNHTPSSTDDGVSVAKWLEVTPDGDNGFIAEERSQAADVQTRVAEGYITSSLFGATDKAGIPDAITMQMANILASKIDFMRDLRKDDSFRVVYEAHSHDGNVSGAGRILALEFKNRDKIYEAVWFSPEGNQKGSYYDFDGRSLKGAFLRTALKFSRISSTFGMRKHPIHGRWTGHKGVDYAAPTGTPIHATADGTVEFVGTQKGYGKTIILKHHGDYTTLYAHQSRFAKGLKKGQKVSQGDLIGYVGSTGWATGPHLHYEFRVAKKPIDPLSVDLPVARALEGPERQSFNQVVAQYRDHIQLIARSQEQNPLLASR